MSDGPQRPRLEMPKLENGDDAGANDEVRTLRMRIGRHSIAMGPWDDGCSCISV
jgi:hypothetical protein